jgi:hypothetical protein
MIQLMDSLDNSQISIKKTGAVEYRT